MGIKRRTGVTSHINCTKKPRYRFELRFQGCQIRRGV